MLLGNGFGFWKTMPIRRRRLTGSVSGVVMSSPSNRISPCIRNPGMRSFIRLKQRIKVLLPQPEGPIRAVILLRGISIETSRSASAAPYQTESARVDSTTGSSAAGASAGRASGLTEAAWASGTLIVLPGSSSGAFHSPYEANEPSSGPLARVTVTDDDRQGIHRQKQD